MEDEISLFVGKNPVLGMLKPWQKPGRFFIKQLGFPGNHLSCAIFWLCFRWITGRTDITGEDCNKQASQDDYHYWNSLKTT
jgi:hypothetical protein